MKTILFSFIFCLIHICLTAQPGTLDKSFGNAGKVISQNYTGAAYASLIQPDGKIVIGGSGTYYKNNVLTGGSLLARYNTDGTLDASFADSGRGIYILGDTGIYIPTIKAIALQPDGKIVALGNFAEQNGVFGSVSLMRFNADGSADKSFGIGGLAISQISIWQVDYAMDAALLPDGRIVVVGDSYKDFYSFENSFIACYTPDGKFDRSFGDTGIINISPDIGGKLNSVVITSNGKIVTGGFGPGYEIVFRYNIDGTPDSSFGENGLGKMFFENSDNPSFNDIALDKEGRIITGGSNILSKGRAITVGRFTEDGKTDYSFSDDGYTYTQYSKGDAYCNTVAVQEDGKIIAGGFHSVNEIGTFTVIRYMTDGSVDSSFGDNGIDTTFFYGDDIGNSVNIQKDGKIILAGYSQVPAPEYNRVDIARYNSDLTQKQIIINKIKHYISTHNNANTVTLNKNINLYPNPANNIVTINNLDAKTNYGLSIINNKGNVVATKQVSNLSLYQFNIQNVSSGVYYVNVVANNKLITTLKF
ncbi:MAG: T9SS type A sorting domain-containing protein, partial [Parafilimonas sp.]